MKPSDYIEKAVAALLEEDERTKALFYAHTHDPLLVQKLHQTHHKIKQWVEWLTTINDEIVENENQQSVEAPDEEPVFYIRRRDMRDAAKGIIAGSGFRVFRGSYISPDIVENMYEIVKKLRQDHQHNIDSAGHLITDLDFDNAGQAARFVTGKQVNGIEEWRTGDGITLKEYQRRGKRLPRRPANS